MKYFEETNIPCVFVQTIFLHAINSSSAIQMDGWITLQSVRGFNLLIKGRLR